MPSNKKSVRAYLLGSLGYFLLYALFPFTIPISLLALLYIRIRNKSSSTTLSDQPFLQGFLSLALFVENIFRSKSNGNNSGQKKLIKQETLTSDSLLPDPKIKTLEQQHQKVLSDRKYFLQQKHLRKKMEYGSERWIYSDTDGYKSLYVPTNVTMQTVAKHYEKKYGIKITCLNNKTELENAINKLIKLNNSNQSNALKYTRYGFAVPTPPDYFPFPFMYKNSEPNPEGHVTPIILEGNKLYIFDAAGNSIHVANTLLKEVCDKNGIQIIVDFPAIRQADPISCRTDALNILKEGLRFNPTKSLEDAGHIFTTEEMFATNSLSLKPTPADTSSDEELMKKITQAIKLKQPGTYHYTVPKTDNPKMPPTVVTLKIKENGEQSIKTSFDYDCEYFSVLASSLNFRFTKLSTSNFINVVLSNKEVPIRSFYKVEKVSIVFEQTEANKVSIYIDGEFGKLNQFKKDVEDELNKLKDQKISINFITSTAYKIEYALKNTSTNMKIEVESDGKFHPEMAAIKNGYKIIKMPPFLCKGVQRTDYLNKNQVKLDGELVPSKNNVNKCKPKTLKDFLKKYRKKITYQNNEIHEENTYLATKPIRTIAEIIENEEKNNSFNNFKNN